MSIAQRAIDASAKPLVQDIQRDATDRDRLREEWRVAADLHVDLDDLAQRLKEGKSIFYDELLAELIAGGMRVGEAERTANTSDAYKQYLHRMHDARKAAAKQRVEVENRDRIYWSHVSREANSRAETRMAR